MEQKVLFVEDNHINRFLANTIFSTWLKEIKFLQAEDGIKGVEAFIKERPNLVIMDLKCQT